MDTLLASGNAVARRSTLVDWSERPPLDDFDGSDFHRTWCRLIIGAALRGKCVLVNQSSDFGLRTLCSSGLVRAVWMPASSPAAMRAELGTRSLTSVQRALLDRIDDIWAIYSDYVTEFGLDYYEDPKCPLPLEGDIVATISNK